MDPSQANKPTCLCIELDPDFYYLIQSYAERCGLCALHVAQAGEALRLARQIGPVLICLEPEQCKTLTAWEVAAALKAHPDTAAIPLILFSWLEEEEQALSAGVDVYVKKPVMYVDFVDALETAGIRRPGP